MKLNAKERCPLHGRRDCCGRAEFTRYRKPAHTKWEKVRTGWKRIKDDSNLRGWRYRLSPAAMKEVLNQKIRDQHNLCALCGKEMDDCRNITNDHIVPKKFGGSERDDHPDNIQAVHHFPCNLEKGSKRI